MPLNECVLTSGESKIAANHGFDFEFKLLVLFLIRAIKHEIKFRLLCNVKGYGCWDDLIVQYSYMDKSENKEVSRIVLVQAKHSDAAKKKATEVTLRDLKKKTQINFVLTEFFEGYVNACKMKLKDVKVPIDCVIYTNRIFNKAMDKYILTDKQETVKSNNNKSFELLNTGPSEVATKLNFKKLKEEIKDLQDYLDKEECYQLGFIDSLNYCMNQSNEKDLDIIIKNEYNLIYPDDGKNIVESVFIEVLANVKAWRKKKTDDNENKQEFLTHESRIFETAREKEIIKDIQSRSKQKLDRTPYKGLQFSNEYLNSFVNDISGSVTNVFTSKNALTLTTLKVFQAFKNDKNQPIIIDLIELATYYEFRKIISAETRQVVIVNCIDQTGDFKSMFQNLSKVLKDNSNIKIILIRKDCQTDIYFNPQENVAETSYVDYYKLSQFDTKNKISENTITLQERKVKLSSLVSSTSVLKMTPNIMKKLLDDKISIGPPIENLNKICTYYLQRTLHRNDKMKFSIVTDDSLKDILIINAASKDDFTHARIQNHDNRTLIASDDDKAALVFDELSRGNKKSNVHLLQLSAQNGSFKLNWKKSSNSMQNIVKYFESHSTPTNMHNEEDFLIKTRNDQINLITDIAGMGKTCVLKSLANNKVMLKSDFVLQIDVKDLAQVITKENTNKYFPTSAHDALKFLLNDVLHYDESKIYLNITFVLASNIRIFLDGLDEIKSEYSKKIIDLIKCLTCFSNFKFYIVSRPNLQRELEITFNTISYKLQYFTPYDQINFLKKFYCSELGITESLNKVKEFSEHVLKYFQEKLEDSVQEFAGIPLLTRMIANIYLESLKIYLNNGQLISLKQDTKIGLYMIYNDFFTCKYELYYEKNPRPVDDREEQIRLENIKKTKDNHINLSVYFFCKEEHIDHKRFFLQDGEGSHLDTLLKNKSENAIGIVSEIKDNGDVIFVHRSFAEFLFAEYILENMKLTNLQCITDFKIFTDEKWKLVQKFIDSYLSEDFNNKLPVLYKAVVNLKFHECEISPLITALIVGNSYICRLIIESINMCYPKGKSAVIDENKSRVFNTLIQKQVRDGLNALHHAVLHNENNKPNTVLLLLSQITAIQNVNDLVHKGMAILHLAVAHKCTSQEVQKIINYDDTDVHVKDKDGNTALHLAAREGRSDLTILLLGFKVDGIQTDHNLVGELPEDNLMRTSRSLSLSADINVKNADGNTALHLAAWGGHIDIVKLLLDSKADDVMGNNEGNTVLHEAASHGHSDVVRSQQDCQNEFEIKRNYSNTALHYAARSGSYKVVKLLLDQKAGINVKNYKCETALHDAACNGHIRVVNLLLKNGADINCKSMYGCTARDVAARENKLSIVKILDEHAARIKAFHEAASDAQCDVARLLQCCGADISILNNVGNTAFHMAARRGHCHVVTILLERGAQINCHNMYNDTALHLASRRGHCGLVTLLLKLGADISSQNDAGNTALHEAARGGHCDVMTLLLDLGSDYNSDNKHGNKALHEAARRGHCNVVKTLLDRGTYINSQNKNGDTSLHETARGGHCDVVTLLLDFGADINIQNNDGNKALHEAARGGHCDVVKMLLNHGADYNSDNKHGYKALHEAARGGHCDVVKMLLDHGADYNSDNKHSNKALHVAARHGHCNMVTFLLECGVQINIQNNNGNTALHEATYGGFCDMVTLLLQRGVDIRIKNNEGLTALDVAGRQKEMSIFFRLAGHGAKNIGPSPRKRRLTN